MTEAAPDRTGLVLGNVGKATLNEQRPQIGGLGRGHQPQAVRPATAACDQTHPPDHLDPLDNESRLAGTTWNAGAEGARLKAAPPLGEVGRLDAGYRLRRGRNIEKVEAELILAAHRPPAGQRRRRTRV